MNVFQETWRTIPEGYLKKLQEILPENVQPVFKNKGGHTTPQTRKHIRIVQAFISFLSGHIMNVCF